MAHPKPNHFLRFLFFTLVVRPVILIVLGLNVRGREKLPRRGPAIIAANHNSHLDAMALMTLFPHRTLPKLRPVAAADVFLANKRLAWFALKVIGILPLLRSGFSHKSDPLEGCCEALAAREILVLFPEGKRGEPERFEPFKAGVARLAERFPEVPVVPVFMYGMGKALPRNEALLVPFFCDVFIGDTLKWQGDRKLFMEQLEGSVKEMAGRGNFPAWE